MFYLKLRVKERQGETEIIHFECKELLLDLPRGLGPQGLRPVSTAFCVTYGAGLKVERPGFKPALI